MEHHRRPGRPRVGEADTPTPDAILEAAARMFMELGYDGVSIADLAGHCGVTKATVYYYFHNKASLFTLAMTLFLERSWQYILQILSRDQSLYHRLREVALLRLTVSAPQVDMGVLMREADAVLLDTQRQAMQAAEEKISQALADAFADATRRNEVHTVDPALAAHAFLAMVSVGTARGLDGGRRFGPPEEAVDAIMGLLWRGLQAPVAQSLTASPSAP